MSGIWDFKADMVSKGDNKRDVSPIKTFQDDNGVTHYVFRKLLFNNPWYIIPKDNFELFEKFVDGGSRAYPSDGSIPCDVVAGEARKVLNRIVSCSEDPNHIYHKKACDSLSRGKFSLVRGTMKIYLGKYTNRDWRRKRFTDDIDFWCFNVDLLEHALKQEGWIRNKKTGEWEKKVHWINPDTNERKEQSLCAANNLNQLLDFGAGAYLEGTELKQIFDKKIKRGHDVDLSDIMNIVLDNDKLEGNNKEEWQKVWISFEEAGNTRNTRITSNLISLCRYSLAIADHLERVGQALVKFYDLIFDKSKYPDERIKRMIRTSIHWQEFYKEKGIDETRRTLHQFYHEQAEEKPFQVLNLRSFANKILELLNSKYSYRQIIFEIED